MNKMSTIVSDELEEALISGAKNSEFWKTRDAKRAVEWAWSDYFDLLRREGASSAELSTLKRMYVTMRNRLIKEVSLIWGREDHEL